RKQLDTAHVRPYGTALPHCAKSRDHTNTCLKWKLGTFKSSVSNWPLSPQSTIGHCTFAVHTALPYCVKCRGHDNPAKVETGNIQVC
ncbi:hypothetical protein J6590_071142, partial [Homalodisca vitripennis]